MRGKLIVIEGGDGAGKSTQIELLINRMRSIGRSVEYLHFPKHESRFGKVVDMYLRGEFGSKDDLSPEFISLLYITDFYETKKFIETSLNIGKDIVLSRFFQSTLSYEVALENKDKKGLWNWIRETCSRLPQPDTIIVLDTPLSISKKLMNNRNRVEGYKKGEKKDQHEADLEFQQKVRDEYKNNIKKLGWKRIDCTSKEGDLLSIDEIHEKIWKTIDVN